jgi:UDP-N-acetylmuramate-alanine ligase
MTSSRRPIARYHFSGIAGAGMNPLARLMRAQGHAVQGSDRSFDLDKNRELAAELRALGIELVRQDGSAIHRHLDRLIYSTAVEADTPELKAARSLGIELVPRPALLAEIVNEARPGVAVAGSGKSTITGMLAWLVREAGIPATVLGGAGLVGEGVTGCFLAGPAGGPVIAEACESDGTLAGYRPAIGVIHSISRDHGEVDALLPQFTAFARACARLLVNARSPEARALGRLLGARAYGTGLDAGVPLEILSAGPLRATGMLHLPTGTLKLDIPQPGFHNLENAAAAALVATELGVVLPAIEDGLRRFPGVARRFEVIGTTASGIRVVDDYAHNGEKLRAAITTAQAGADRILAVFQPHGFGPARFLRPELRELLPRILRAQDRFCYAEIFYAGGTVNRDVSAAMLADDFPAHVRCAFAPDHAAVVGWVRNEARPGDTVLIMGARDPDLPRLARAVLQVLGVPAPPDPLPSPLSGGER